MDKLWKRLSGAAGDSHFGPTSSVYNDLTLKFEDTIFTTGPASLLLALLPFYIWRYRYLPVITAEDPLIFLKLGANGLLIALNIASAVLYNAPDDSPSISRASSIIACLAALALAVFMHLEHRHARESSPVPAIFLFVTLLLDAARARSYFLRREIGLYSVACVTVAIAVTKLLLLALSEIPKRYESKNDELVPESTSGFWARTFFIWVNSTLLLGFRNILTIADLPNLDADFASTRLAAVFQPVWAKQFSSSRALMKATCRAQLWPFLSVVPARLLFIGFKFAEPLLLQRILKEIGKDDRDPEAIQGLIGAMALVHLGLTVTQAWYKHMNNRVVVQTRGILVSQILDKSFLLGHHEAKRSAASTLMSTDTDGVVDVIPELHETWASVVELALSIYLLWTVVYYSAFLTILPAIAAAVFSLQLGKRLAPAVQSWNDSIENRVSITAKILSQLRGIKMTAVEGPIGKYVQFLRHTEVERSKGVRIFGIWRTIGLTMSYAFTPIVVIASALYWSGFNGSFGAVNAFTALAYIYLASDPMGAILISWSQIGEMVACFNRIQAYLLLPEYVDSREQFPLLDEKKPTYDLERFPIQFENASVASPDGRILFTTDVSFKRATITMVIGPTGVGKSTMLRSVLGESQVASGSIYVLPQQIAYCGQEEWVRNITIRENIIGHFSYDETWYNTVTRACLLLDLNEFPLGHLTLAGTRGANLSGGQRQRVELARAVYSRAKVVILDGVLSAVDRHSAAEILKRLIGEDGLLRKLGATVIMSTHSVELLKSADQVLVLHSNGTVSTQSPEKAIKKYEGKGFLDDFSDDEDDISDRGGQDDSPARHYTPPEPKEPITTDFRQTGDLALYKYYMKSVSTWIFIVWIFVLVILVVTEKAPDIYMRLWVERNPHNKLLFIGYALFGVVTVFVNMLWSRLYFMYLVPKSAENLHLTLVNSVINANLSFLTYTDSGALLNRFSQDMSLIIKDLPIKFFYFTYALFGLFVLIGIIASALYYLRTSRQLRLLDIEANSPIYTFLTECSEGIYHIRALQNRQQYLSQGLELLDQSQKPFYYRYCIQRWLAVVLDLTVGATAVTLAALALNIGSASQAAVGLGLLKVMQLSSYVAHFIEQWVDLETSLGALSRIRAFEKDTPQEEAGAGDVPTLPENWPHRGQIRVENLNADHVINGEDYRALHELSFNITPGSKVGIVGRTGSGKTTFLLTLLNFLKFSGSIIIDGIDITTIPRHLLRSRITTISQEFIDLPGSIRDNLAPHEIMIPKENRQDNALLANALVKVGLDRMVDDAGGLDTALKDVGLSAGQQQLLALARALLHQRQTNSKIVFVDEATSFIDYDSEEKLREVMDKAFKDCTVLTISHRNHSLQSATNFLELSSGRLVSYE